MARANEILDLSYILFPLVFEIQIAIWPSTRATQFGDRLHYKVQIQFTYPEVAAAYVLPPAAIKSDRIFAR